jgi:site-specific DNA recombinase
MQRTGRDRPVRGDAEYARISRDKRGAAEGVETQQAENADAADELRLIISVSYVDNDLSAYSGGGAPGL